MKDEDIARKFSLCVDGYKLPCTCMRCNHARIAIKLVKEAKKEVFDDIERKIQSQGKIWIFDLDKIKKRHLSTFQKVRSTK